MFFFKKTEHVFFQENTTFDPISDGYSEVSINIIALEIF